MRRKHQPGCPCCCPAKICVQLIACSQPQAGKAVRVTGPGGYDTTVGTNASGFACFEGLTTGTYSIIPPAIAGYLTESTVQVTVTSECANYTVVIRYRKETYKVCAAVRSCTRCDGKWDWLDGIMLEASIGGTPVGDCMTGDGSGIGCQQDTGDATCCIEIDGSLIPKSGTIDVVITTKNHPPGYGNGSCTLTISIDSCYCNHCVIALPLADGYVCGCCGPVKAELQIFDAGQSGTLSIFTELEGCPEFCEMCRDVHCLNWFGSISWTEPEAARCTKVDGHDCCIKATALVTVCYRLSCDPVDVVTSSGTERQVQWTLCRTWLICAKFDLLLPIEQPDGSIIYNHIVVCGEEQREHARLLSLEECSSGDCFGYCVTVGDKLTTGPNLQGCASHAVDLAFEPDCTKLCGLFGICYEPYLPDELRDTIIITE